MQLLLYASLNFKTWHSNSYDFWS